MSIRVLFDSLSDRACLYSSGDNWAFGPLFHGKDDCSAQDRAEAFLLWLRRYQPTREDQNSGLPWRHEPSQLTDVGLEAAYRQWTEMDE